MRWAIQSTLINPVHSEQVLAAVKALGKAFILADHIPFDDKFIEEPEGTDFIPYGSTTVMKMALARGWEGLAFEAENFQHSGWVHYRDDMLNHRAEYRSALRIVTDAECYGISDASFFIRPDNDLKSFNGQVIQHVELIEWLKKAINIDSSLSSITDSTLIVVAKPQTLWAEWRCFVVDGNVIDASMYRCNGQPRLLRETNPALKSQFKRMAEKWLPHRNCCMDIALTSDGFRVVEFNCINTSGFYDHDIALIVKVLDKSYG